MLSGCAIEASGVVGRCRRRPSTSSASMAPQRTPRSTNPASARTVAGSSSTAPVVRSTDGAQPFGCLGLALAVEGVGGEVPGEQLVGVQVPALEEPAFERPAHEPRVQRATLRPARRRRAGCWSIRRRGGCRCRPPRAASALREVGCGVIERLLLRRRCRARRCSRRCRVQPADAPGTGERQLGERARPSAPSTSLRRLDLHLESDPPSGRPYARSSAVMTSAIASTCATVDTFGRVSARPSGSPPFSMSVPMKRSSVRRPRAPGRRSSDLNLMPMNGGATPAPPRGDPLGGARRRRRLRRRRRGRRSRLRSRCAGPRSVRARASRARAAATSAASVASRPTPRRRRRGRRLVDGGARRRAPHSGQLRAEPVGGDVDGVHRLARAVVAGVRVRSRSSVDGEAGVDRGEIGGEMSEAVTLTPAARRRAG